LSSTEDLLWKIIAAETKHPLPASAFKGCAPACYARDHVW